MKTTNVEPRVQINHGDVVSGTFFREFVGKYKAYDAKQKEIIAKQNRQINNLKSELAYYKNEVPEETDVKKKKLKMQGKTIFDLNIRISNLLEENRKLKEQLGMTEQ